MRTVMTLGLIAGLALAASRAHAVWLEVQLTPRNTDQWNQSFAVSARDIEGMIELRVTVEPKQGKEISPFTSGQLMVIEDNRHVASVPVAVSRDGKKVTFRFRLAPAAAARSRFDIHEQGWEPARNPDGTPQRDEHGVPMMEMTLGGQAYWFWVRDFAGSS